METAPVKSRALHNFFLPDWNSCYRCPRTSPPPPPHHRSPFDSGLDSEPENPSAHTPGTRSLQNQQQPERDVSKAGDDAGGSQARGRNLRPKKVVAKVGGSFEIYGAAAAVRKKESVAKSRRLRGEGEEKTKFWISLSREEIEEDVYALTGSKPGRRPRKRPKNVQKLLDNVFPGLYLGGLTADSYRYIDALVYTAKVSCTMSRMDVLGQRPTTLVNGSLEKLEQALVFDFHGSAWTW
ncbi:hypothetical protein RJ640_012900 [Escallonia rubra]|uniref:Uncharacterized protein n=1 Tax=Escallonia rubra TaxID=112253 RepID=A0AA88R3B9_9ASTE|nr:hypothetical protein RJ640_012900 [Escallonia rubra]